jgi:hypothetical protein
MKLRILSLFSLLLFVSPIYSQCVRNGTFQDGLYIVTGSVTMEYTIGGSKLLKIGDDFSTDTGPDLYVYLSNSTDFTTGPSITPDDVEELGLLTSLVIDGIVTGASTYTIPDDVDIGNYKYVVIQCKAFNAFWGYSELGEPQGSACSTLSVEDEIFKSVSFYPNPAKNKFLNFDNNYFEDDIKVNIYNSVGHVIIKNENIKRGRHQFSLSNISSGIYFVELKSREGRIVKKLIVQ